jgi:dihydropteroate synthase
MPKYPLRLVPVHSRRTTGRLLAGAGVDPAGIGIITQKTDTMMIQVDRVSAAAANILKQQLLSLGGDAAVHREVITGRPDSTTVYIVGDARRLGELPDRLAYQPFGLPDVGTGIGTLLDRLAKPPCAVPIPGGTLDLTREIPLVVGILNVTPDSFSDGGLYADPVAARDRAQQMEEEGADIIDIGGESSRPGSHSLTVGEELDRVMGVLDTVASAVNVPISIDTRKAGVARAATRAGAVIINDISGFEHDPHTVEVAVETGAAVVIMHMQGTPDTMQDNPHYDDAVSEIIEWLGGRAAAMIAHGVPREKIIVDPGIGFGKRLRDNLALIEEIAAFHGLGFPVLVGYSRKSFIGGITGREPTERIAGGLAALGKCLEGGVQFVRVHDVKETTDFIKVWRALEKEDGPA